MTLGIGMFLLTLVMSMLKSIFSLHTKTQNFHFKYTPIMQLNKYAGWEAGLSEILFKIYTMFILITNTQKVKECADTIRMEWSIATE